jgi:hypothetical protein
MADRPLDFRINYGHPLAAGLVFAGLGRHPNSTYCHDSSLYTRNGTLVSMAVPATATSGWTKNNFLGRWGLTCDGLNDYLSIPSSVLNGLTQFTISAWIQSIGARGFPMPEGRNPTGAMFALDDTTHKLYFAKMSGNQYAYGTAIVGDNTLHHVTCTYNAAAATVLKFFIDGKPDALSTSNVTGSAIGTYTNPMTVGRAYNSTYWPGFVSDFAIFNRDLSQAEIGVLANPADPMLGGMLEAVGRRVWAVGPLPPLFNAARYVQSRRQLQGA